MGKFLRKIVIICLFAVLLEVFYFNFSTLQILLDTTQNKDLRFVEKDADFINWEQQGDIFVSTSIDPQTYIELDPMKIYTVLLQMSTIPEIDHCQFFYTNDNGEIVVVDGVRGGDGNIEFRVNDWSSNMIRIDIGDAPEIQLEKFIVIVNPAQWDISPSRIVAIILIYLFGSLLFRIQRMPDYGIHSRKDHVYDI